MFKIMVNYRIDDTGSGLRLYLKNSYYDLTYTSAKMLALAITKALETHKKKGEQK